MSASEASTTALNGDLSKRIVVDTEAMEWTASPAGQVLRKRLHRVGPPESGQVTSVVRYEPGASFPSHPHPEGEEIFVLEGTFSDHAGHATAGTHLLNAEGFEHAPYSEEGCLLFVKLRQYAGTARPYRRTDTTAMAWEPSERAGIETKCLFESSSFPDTVSLERWEAGARSGKRRFEGGAEIFVLEGSFSDSDGEYAKHSWLRLPPGVSLDAVSERGCVLYLKIGGVVALRSGD